MCPSLNLFTPKPVADHDLQMAPLSVVPTWPWYSAPLGVNRHDLGPIAPFAAKVSQDVIIINSILKS